MIQLRVLPLMAWWQQQRYQSRLKSLLSMVNKLGYKCVCYSHVDIGCLESLLKAREFAKY